MNFQFHKKKYSFLIRGRIPLTIYLSLMSATAFAHPTKCKRVPIHCASGGITRIVTAAVVASVADARTNVVGSYVGCNTVSCAEDVAGRIVQVPCGTPNTWSLCTQWGVDGPSGGDALQCTLVNWGTVGGNSGPTCLQAYTPDDGITTNCDLVASSGDNNVWCDTFSGIVGPTCSSIGSVGASSDATCVTYWGDNIVHYAYPSCFTEKNLFKVKSSSGSLSWVAAKDIRVGMDILSHYDNDGTETYSPVIRYPHYEESRTKHLIGLRVQTETSTLELTEDHLIPVIRNGRMALLFFKEIRKGDQVRARGRTETITSDPVHFPTHALYAFHTASGAAVVFNSPSDDNGIEASVFSTYKSAFANEALFRVRDIFSYLTGTTPLSGEEAGASSIEGALLEAFKFVSPWGFPETDLNDAIKPAPTTHIGTAGARALNEISKAPVSGVNVSSGFDPRQPAADSRSLRGSSDQQ